MCDFVSHDSHRAVLDQVVVSFIFFQLEKPLVIPREREHSSPFPDTSDAKDKIPLFLRVQISHTDPYHAKSVSRQLTFEHRQDVPCIELRFLSVLVYAGLDALHVSELFSYLYLHGMEETLTIVLKFMQKI